MEQRLIILIKIIMIEIYPDLDHLNFLHVSSGRFSGINQNSKCTSCDKEEDRKFRIVHYLKVT